MDLELVWNFKSLNASPKIFKRIFTAFVSFPDALAKMKFVPQLFSACFFLMLFLLGIGSLIAMSSVVTTVVKDRFPKVKNWQCGLCFSVVGVISASIYITPVRFFCFLKFSFLTLKISKGGQSVLTLIDFYGATFVAVILAVAELMVFCYMYGVTRICKDVEFMLGRKMGPYWKICWRFLTPALMTTIAFNTLWNFELPTDGDYEFPVIAHVIGWSVAAICLSQVVIFALYKLSRTKSNLSLWGVGDKKQLERFPVKLKL